MIHSGSRAEDFAQISSILVALSPILARGLSPDQRETVLRNTPVRMDRAKAFDQVVVYQALLDAFREEGNIDFVEKIISRVQGYSSFYRPVGPDLNQVAFLLGEYMEARKAQQKPYVFVLMPFRKDYFVVYEKCIRPTLESLGCTVEHADEVKTVDLIIDVIITKIRQAHFLVADTTDMNPNVFYELGYAHALGKKVILIVQDVSHLPFDVGGLKHILYRPDSLHALSQDLEKVASVLLAEQK